MNKEPTDRRHKMRDWLVALILVEAVCVLIGLIMPITPSKTGGSWNPAALLVDRPTYLDTAIAWFCITNVLIVSLGLIVWLSVRLKRN